MKLKKILATAMIAGCFGLTSHAYAAPIHWNLVDMTFDDGGTGSGTFEFDTSTLTFVSYDITTTAGSSFAGFHYDGVGDTPLFIAPSYFVMGQTSFDPALTIAFATYYYSDSAFPLGFVNPLISGSYEMYDPVADNGSFSRRIITGGYAVAVAAPVPEPETYTMMLTGLGLLGVMGRRRKQRPTSMR